MNAFLLAPILNVSVPEVPEMPEHYIEKAWAFLRAVHGAKIKKANEQGGGTLTVDVTDLLPM